MIRNLFAVFILLMPFTLFAQSNSDTIKRSPVRTLTYEQYQAYLKGEAGADAAYVAEVHHYPLPDKVLKLKKELTLSTEQAATIMAIYDHMHGLRVQIGGSIIDNEKTIDLMFAQNTVSNGNLIFFVNRYGSYQAELRNAILQACIATKKVLTPEQMKLYDSLRKPN